MSKNLLFSCCLIKRQPAEWSGQDFPLWKEQRGASDARRGGEGLKDTLQILQFLHSEQLWAQKFEVKLKVALLDISEALRPPCWLIWKHQVIGRGSHMSPEDAAVIFLWQ